MVTEETGAPGEQLRGSGPRHVRGGVGSTVDAVLAGSTVVVP